MFLKTIYGLNKSILAKGNLKLPLPTRLETQHFLHSFSYLLRHKILIRETSLSHMLASDISLIIY